MSNLDEIQKLYTKTKSFKIGDADIDITPLSLEDMGVMDMKEDATMAEVSRNAIKMFSISLKISEDDAKKISFEFMEELLKNIMGINNFNDKDLKKSGIKEFIERKQEASRTKA